MTATTSRVRAILRLLLDSGDITPMGVRQIERVLDAEEAKSQWPTRQQMRRALDDLDEEGA